MDISKIARRLAGSRTSILRQNPHDNVFSDDIYVRPKPEQMKPYADFGPYKSKEVPGRFLYLFDDEFPVAEFEYEKFRDGIQEKIIHVDSNYRGRKIPEVIYDHFLKMGAIYSDGEQTADGARLWAKFFQSGRKIQVTDPSGNVIDEATIDVADWDELMSPEVPELYTEFDEPGGYLLKMTR